jgi:uncharacterized protein YraI
VVIGTIEHRVAFVLPNDTLNVRSGAGVTKAVVGTIGAGDAGIFLTNNRTIVAGSQWVQIQQNDLQGWVNSRFLTEAIPSNTFCNDPAARQTLDTFVTEMTERSGLTGPNTSTNADRGLRVHMNWWNPEVKITDAELINAFTSNATANWGVADGTGDAIVGTTSEVVLPKIDQDLAPAAQIACNEILHGGTAGFVRLPEEYAGINYFSVHRPAPTDGIEFDWGTWVIGIEKWDGDYFVSFIVHYQWEI